jgi:hypothetical protein
MRLHRRRAARPAHRHRAHHPIPKILDRIRPMKARFSASLRQFSAKIKWLAVGSNGPAAPNRVNATEPKIPKAAEKPQTDPIFSSLLD